MSIRTDTPRNAAPWQGVSTKLTRKAGVLPALPAGFAYSQLADGSYEVWPDGAYVVEYVG